MSDTYLGNDDLSLPKGEHLQFLCDSMGRSTSGFLSITVLTPSYPRSNRAENHHRNPRHE